MSETITGFTVSFNRIGRTHDVLDLAVATTNPDEIAGLVYRYARPMLRSRDVEVVVNLETMRGSIFCGFNNGGTFTLAAAEVTS